MAEEQKEEKKEETTQPEQPKETPSSNESKAEAQKASTPEDKGSDSAKAPEVPAKFKKLVEEIEKMSVLDLSELVKALEDRFGVSATPVAVAGGVAPSPGGEADSGEAEDSGKTKFNVVLKDGGAQKINAIKAVREISGLGLAESKAIVDGAPKVVKEDLSKEEAEEAKKKLEEAGATVELE